MKKGNFLLLMLVIFIVGLFITVDSQSLKPVFFKLKDIKDVSNTAPSDGQVLSYVASTGLYTPTTATSLISAASTTVAGIVELAIASEVNTGTSTTLAVTPDALAGSVFGTRTLILKVMEETTVVTSGDGKMYFTIPVELNGMDLVSIGAHVYTADTGTNHISVNIYRTTGTAHNMLSAAMQIEDGETDTITSAIP